MRRLAVVIFGGPGSGKGTISGKIVKDFTFNHISTGDLLRKSILSGDELGKSVKSIIEQGKLVPDNLMIDVLVKNTTGIQGNLLLDGYPRTIEQAKSLAAHIPIDSVIALDIPRDTIVQRLSGRWTHLPSGRTYAYDYNPPKKLGFDDVTGEKLVQRDDDKPESIIARLQAYDELTSPLKKFYESAGILRVFSGTQSDVIYPEIKKYLLGLKK